MIKISFPSPNFRIRKEQGRDQLFDPLRKQWVVLTPEEWVRQNFIQYLVQTLQFPEALIAVEKQMKLGELNKRFDILVYDKDHQPWMMVECKAQTEPLAEKVFDQILRYHVSIPVTYLVITNGDYTRAWRKETTELVELSALPSF
ncbi:MAG: type I restriction enzyme HsdR N-terminal domain-containing protein [Chitinophagales bacterium]|nr:type I restriction enzyme HsdR N-terminal domain-containing protein [Chitinophagales bacterium]